MGDNEKVYSLLNEGIKNGEWFDIVYHGGSNPGARRRIAPIALSGEKLRAHCYTSKAVKVFLISKVEILEREEEIGQTTEWRADETPKDFPGIHDVREVHARFSEALEARGWRVGLTETEEGWHLMLFGFFKNGKPRKNPSLVLSYEHTASDSVVTDDGRTIRENVRPRVRPWSFGGTFTHSYKPVLSFLLAAGLDVGRVFSGDDDVPSDERKLS